MYKIDPSKIYAWVEKNFEFKERKGGVELVICNPFNNDTKFHLCINTSKGVCNDWRGNEWMGFSPSGKLIPPTFINFVAKYKKCSTKEAVKEIGAVYSPRKREIKQQVCESDIKLPDNAKHINDSSPIGKIIKNWLSSRGISNKIGKYNLMHKYFDVIIPYFEFDELVYWISRSTIEKIFYYPPLEGSGKSDFLFGFDNVKTSDYLIITEAQIDCMSIDDQSVAIGGISVSDIQIKKIKFLNPKNGIILAPDNDDAGVKSVIKNASLLKKLGYKIYYSIPPKNIDNIKIKDWNDIASKTNENVRDILENNIKALTYKEKLSLFHLTQ